MEIINSFPGYEYVGGKNMYRGEDVGKGGYVYAEPGIYRNVALLDVASMHPSSIIALNLFGDYTPCYKELIDIRIAIKHKDFDTARRMFDGKLERYLTDEDSADMLSKALKLPINASYGLTAANFENPMRDIRNVNNIVALRGALFMVNLKHELIERGFKPIHIKTDSVKIADATPEVIQFVMDYGKQYGYNFELEAIYSRICLVNGSTYIARYSSDAEINGKHAGEWTATAAQFQVPYVFKTLFSKEPIIFEDLCETKEVTTAIYLDYNESLPADQHDYRFVGKVGSFCPIKPGCGGAELLRESKDKEGNIKYAAATGSKGYRWFEAELVKELKKENDIDRSYYAKLVDDAVDAISQYGDFEWFVSDDEEFEEKYMNPPWKMACGKDSCYACPNFNHDEYHMDCTLGYDISDLIIAEENDDFKKR